MPGKNENCNRLGSGVFCMYPDAGFKGNPQVYTACGEYNLTQWDVVSSWKSRQYGGAVVEVYTYPPATAQ
jgi:hypothetical protein